MTDVHSRIRSRVLPERKQRTRTAVGSGRAAETNRTLQADATSLRLHVICVVATLIAASIFTLTEHDDHRHTWWCAFEITVQTLLVIVGTVFFRTRQRLLRDSSVVQPILVMVVALTLLCEPFQRLFLGHGHPFEVMVMHSQSNLMLALAVCGFRLTFQRLAMLIAVFLTIFSCTISNAVGLLPLTILFAIGCLMWLVASWWETVDRRLVRTEQRRRPWIWLGTSIAVPSLLMLTAVGFGANTVTTALRGFMPSSGGTGQFDPFSRGGVKDGDALVAGNENIKSFAPLEDAPFLDSDKPSLYDVFNDMFDEPPKKIKDQQRSVALPADVLKHIHQQMAEAKQAGREFSLLRSKKRADKKRIHDLETHAMFYVAGRTPARFRMEVYDHFDGITWYPLGDLPDARQRRVEMKQIDERPWLSLPLPGRGFEMYAGSDTHSVKVVNLDGNVIPTPPHVVGVSIDRVDREDMYSVSTASVVSLQRQSIPQMLAISVTSECVDRNAVRKERLTSLVQPSHDATRLLPDDSSSETIRRLAETWTVGLPRGWLQVEAIEARLRQDYIVDRAAKISEDCESPVTEFLLEQRRGPEYLFASSAASLLRSLGYSTRLVSGFYARPENYDDHKQHTAVFAADAHFWCEVFIGTDTWLTVEPSPGYAIPVPPPTLWTRLRSYGQQLLHAAVANVVAIVGFLLLAAVLMWKRRRIFERLWTWQWRWLSRSAAPQKTRELSTLVDYRLQLAGMKRANGTTLKRWAQQPQLAEIRPLLLRTAEVTDFAMFGPTGEPLVVADAKTNERELRYLESVLSVGRLRGDSSSNIWSSIVRHRFHFSARSA